MYGTKRLVSEHFSYMILGKKLTENYHTHMFIIYIIFRMKNICLFEIPGHLGESEGLKKWKIGRIASFYYRVAKK